MTTPWRWRHLEPEYRAAASERWGDRAQMVRTDLGPDPCRVIRTAEDGLMMDPCWVSRNHLAYHIFQGKALAPSQQSWRQLQAIRNLPLMGWGLVRGSMPGVWEILGNGPSARDWTPREGIRTMAINGALELARSADVWLVADALDPQNSWQPGPWLDRIGGLPAGVQGVFRCSANHALVEACDQAGRAHLYMPTTLEHRDVIREDICHRLPIFCEGYQGLPTAMTLAWWLGATTIVLWGCDQAWPVGGDYYGSPATPGPPAARIAEHRRKLAPGVRGAVWTTDDHLLAAEQADVVSLFLRDAGCPVWNASQGLDLQFAPPIGRVDPGETCEVLDVEAALV